MSKVYKYNIIWQMARLEVRKIKDITAKLEFINQFLLSNLSTENKERVLNWLHGLKIAYKNLNLEQEAIFAHYRNIFESLETLSLERGSRKYNVKDFNSYSEASIISLLEDLTKRSKTWLNNGYVNEEFNTFILALIGYLNSVSCSSSKFDRLKTVYAGYLSIAKVTPNTHKFLY